MNAGSKSTGYPLVLDSEDLARMEISGSTGTVNYESLCDLFSRKVMPIILVNFHHRKEEDVPHTRVEVLSIGLNTNAPAHWGMLIEVFYRFTNRPKREHYRHVFHFVPSYPGSILAGRVFTHARKYIPR